MITTLKNDFHNTKCRIKIPAETPIDALGYCLTPSQMARVKRELCGVKGCRCGGGIRGKQELGFWRLNDFVTPFGPLHYYYLDTLHRGLA